MGDFAGDGHEPGGHRGSLVGTVHGDEVRKGDSQSMENLGGLSPSWDAEQQG